MKPELDFELSLPSEFLCDGFESALEHYDPQPSDTDDHLRIKADRLSAEIKSLSASLEKLTQECLNKTVELGLLNMMAGDPCLNSETENRLEEEFKQGLANPKACEEERDQYLSLLRIEVQKALSLELSWKALHAQSEKKWETKLQREFDEKDQLKKKIIELEQGISYCSSISPDTICEFEI